MLSQDDVLVTDGDGIYKAFCTKLQPQKLNRKKIRMIAIVSYRNCCPGCLLALHKHCGHFHALGAFKALRQMQNLHPAWNALLLHLLHEMQKVSSVDDPVIQDAGMVTNSHKGTEPVHTKC